MTGQVQASNDDVCFHHFSSPVYLISCCVFKAIDPVVRVI